MHFLERGELEDILEDYAFTSAEWDELFVHLPTIARLKKVGKNPYPEYEYYNNRYGGDDPYELYEGIRGDVENFL